MIFGVASLRARVNLSGFKRGLIFELDLICVVLKGFGNGFDFRAHLICVALEDKVRKWERVWF